MKNIIFILLFSTTIFAQTSASALYEESQKALRFSFSALTTSIVSLILGIIGVLFIGSENGSEFLAQSLIWVFAMIPFTLGFVSLYIVNSIFRKLKKKGKKIKNQERKTKRALYASMIITIPLLLIIPFVVYWAILLTSFLFFL